MAKRDRTTWTINEKSIERKMAKMGSSAYVLCFSFTSSIAVMPERRPISLLTPGMKICMGSGARYVVVVNPIQDACVLRFCAASCSPSSYWLTAVRYSRMPRATLSRIRMEQTANVAANFGLARIALSSFMISVVIIAALLCETGARGSCFVAPGGFTSDRSAGMTRVRPRKTP